LTREEAVREAQRRANREGRAVTVAMFGGDYGREVVHPTQPIKYLSGVTNAGMRKHPFGVGLLVTRGNGTDGYLAKHPFFGVDNGMYGLAKRHQEAKFDAEAFYRWLERLPRTAMFVAAPDVLHFVTLPGMDHEVPVGDAPATLAQFPLHARRIRALGFKVALVGQDGVETMLGEIPWDLVDAIFLGGSDAWKLGEGARILTAEAKRRGLTVHMGRVNSLKRLEYAQAMGCDSADGTFIQFGPDVNRFRVAGWLSELRMTAAPVDGGVNPKVVPINWAAALRGLPEKASAR
jgi:hypothetical protein